SRGATAPHGCDVRRQRRVRRAAVIAVGVGYLITEPVAVLIFSQVAKALFVAAIGLPVRLAALVIAIKLRVVIAFAGSVAVVVTGHITVFVCGARGRRGFTQFAALALSLSLDRIARNKQAAERQDSDQGRSQKPTSEIVHFYPPKSYESRYRLSKYGRPAAPGRLSGRSQQWLHWNSGGKNSRGVLALDTVKVKIFSCYQSRNRTVRQGCRKPACPCVLMQCFEP